jgi:hypothetical protein
MTIQGKSPQLLTSWKEIALHLGKGVRTVQRWEQELGLPVRRPAHSRHIVLAVPSELDEWVKNQEPMSHACSCSDELDEARNLVATLRSTIAALESELAVCKPQLVVSPDDPEQRNVTTLPIRAHPESRGKAMTGD